MSESRESPPTSHPGSPWMWVGKLAPPQMQLESARREALITRLQDYRHMPLMLIVSPPGFGKTTLLAQWRATLLDGSSAPATPAVAWLSLDEADRDAGRFLSYVLLALEEAGLDLQGLSAMAHAQSLDLKPERTVATLLQLLASAGRRYTLMLDDYHRASCPEVDALVLMLLERGSRWLQFVVATRARPPWPLSALKLRGLLHEFDANDLILSLSEASQILGPGMDRAELSIVHSRTEGWAVAIQLARLWLLRGSGRQDGAQGLKTFTGRVSEMAEYLAEQIVDQLPADCREFLMETSLLERFDAELADLVRGRDDSAELLARLLPYEALLVPLDAARSWFRYHHMLADFLRPRLDPRRARHLHRAAAHWLAGQTDWVLAVSHALQAQDTPLAVALVQQAGSWELVVRKGIPYAKSLLQQFDDRAKRTEPELLLTQAYLHAKLGEQALSMELLRLAQAAISPDTASPTLRRDREVVTALVLLYLDRLDDARQWPVGGSVANERYADDPLAQGTLLCVGAVAALAWGRVDEAAQAAQDARVRMRLAGSPLGENYSLIHEAQALALKGQLGASRQRIDEALALAESNFGTDSSLKALVGCFRAQHLYLQGQWTEVGPWLSAGQETLEYTDSWLDVLATTADIAWRVALRQQGLNAALALLDHSSQLARQRQLPRLERLIQAWRIDLCVQGGLLPQAQAGAAALESLLPLNPLMVAGEGFDWRFLEAGSLALARVQIASGAARAAQTRLERAARCMDEAGLQLPAWRLQLMSLLARRKMLDGEALPDAEIQWTLAPLVAQGLHGLLMEAGPALLPLLQRAESQLPAALITQMRGWQTHPPRLQTQPGAQFSAKERQVLELLVAGQANKAIARALDISENTVKFHLKQIFQKLNVDSRGAAIGAALQQGFKAQQAVGHRSPDSVL